MAPWRSGEGEGPGNEALGVGGGVTVTEVARVLTASSPAATPDEEQLRLGL